MKEFVREQEISLDNESGRQPEYNKLKSIKGLIMTIKMENGESANLHYLTEHLSSHKMLVEEQLHKLTH